MPYPHYIQSWSLPSICHAIITCNSWAYEVYATYSLYAVLELTGHMQCKHYMQFRSAWGIYYAIIKCNFWAYEAHVMPSAITLYCFVLLYTILYDFIFHCILSLIDHMALNQGAPATCTMPSSYAVLDFGYAYATALLHAVLEPATHVPYQHYVQFLSLCHMCNAFITCSSGACIVCAMPPLHSVLECMGHMLCYH